MAKQVVVLLTCFLIFTLIQSSYCVSRVFTDEITGYNTPLVTADDVATELMIVNNITVEGSIVSDSEFGHSVDTPGRMAINTEFTNIAAENNIDLTSYGENIAFYGESVDIGANGEFTNDAVHISMASDEISLVGDSLETIGEHVYYRAPEEIFFAAEGDINMHIFDALTAVTSEIDINGTRAITFGSALSNIHFQAGETFLINGTTSVSMTGASGAKILSRTNEVNIFSEFVTTLMGENIQLNGISQSGVISQGGFFNLTAENFDITSDRTIISAVGMNVTTRNQDGAMNFISFGTILAAANHAVIISHNVDITAADQVQFTSYLGTTFNASQDTTISSGSTHYQSYHDILFSSVEEYLTMDFGGVANIGSVNDDFSITSYSQIYFGSFNAAANAAQRFSISSDDLDIQTSDYIELLSEGDMLINVDTFSQTTDEFQIFARENAIMSAVGDATFTSTRNVLHIESSADVIFSSADMSSSANSISYNSLSLMKVTADDEIAFNATNSLSISSGDRMIFQADTLYFNTDELEMNNRNFEIYSDTVDVSAFAVLINTATIGGFVVEAGTLDFISEYIDIASAFGAIEFTSHQLLSITTDDFLLEAEDLLISAVQSIDVLAPAGLTFSVQSDQGVIYGFIETNFNALAGNFIFNGDTTFSAPLARGDAVNINVDTTTLTNTDVAIVGGITAVNLDEDLQSTSTFTNFLSNSGEDATFTTLGDDITFSSETTSLSFEDILHESDTDISWAVDSDFNAFSTFTQITANTGITYTTDALSVSASADDGMILMSGDSGLDITATTFTNNFAQTLTIEGEISNTITSIGSDINVQMTHGSINGFENIIDDTDTVFNTQTLSAVYDVIDIEVDTSVTITASDFTAQSTNELNFLTESALSISASSGMNAQGGDITIIGDNTLQIVSDQDLAFGSNQFQINNLNYHDVIIDTFEDINIETNYWSVSASGVHDYNDTAITFSSTSFSLTCEDYIIYGDNGVDFNSGDFTNTVTDLIDFFSEFGSHEVVSGTIDIDSNTDITQTYLSRQAGYYAFAEVDIEYDVSGSFISNTVENVLHSTSENFGFNTFEAGNDIIINAADRFTFLNGDAKQLEADFDLQGFTGIEITSGNDIRFRTFGGDTDDPDSMDFESTNDSPTSQGSYLITIEEAINMYPSGQVFIGNNDLTFTSTTRNITMGTTQGDMVTSIDDTASYSAGRDYNVTAGGLNGDVDVGMGGSGTYISQNLNVFSNFTTTVDSDNDITMSATARMKFTTFREESGIFHKAEGDISYESQITTGSTGINITGNALTIFSNTQTFIDTFYLEIGQNNAQFNPRLIANVGDWNVNSIGSISLNALNDDFVQNSVDLVSSSATTVLKAGGSMNFKTTWDSLIPGDGLLTVTTESIMSVLAQNIIDINIRNSGTVSSDTTTFTSSGTSTSSPSASGIVFNGNYGDIFYTTDNFNQKINTTTGIHAGNVNVLSTGGAPSSITSLISSNGYIQVQSDRDIFNDATSAINYFTLAPNARMEFFTEGNSSPLAFDASSDASITSVVDQVVFTSGGEISQFARIGGFTLTTGANNNGQLTFDATSDVILSGDDVTLSTLRDFFIDTEGEDSKFNIGVFSDFTANTQQDTSLNTIPGGDGSLKFFLKNKATFSISGNDGIIDSDDKFSVLTNGTFVYLSGEEFETSVGGNLVISSNFSIFLRAETPLSDAPAHVVFNSNASDFIAASKQSTHFEAGYSGFGNITFNLAGDASIIARGNDSGVTHSGLDVYSQGGATIVNAKDGDLDVQGLHRVSLLAYGSVNNSGYVSFVSRNTAAQNQVSRDGISLQSTYRGGDIYFTGIGADMFASDITFTATGKTVESGYISIINTPPSDASIPGGTDYDIYDLFDNPTTSLGALFDSDQPALKFDSGIETEVYAETGDIIVNYGKRFLLHGGSISGIATGGITFFTRGDGRLNNRIIGGQYPIRDERTMPLASFIAHKLDGVTFRTLNAGLGEIRFVSEAGHIRTSAEYAFIRNNEDQLLFEASSTIQLQTRALNSQFPGIVVHSEDFVHFNSIDQEIISTGRNIRYGVLNNNGLLSIDSHANTDSAVNFEAGTAINLEATTVEFDIYGNIDIFNENIFSATALDTLNIYGPNDVNLFYEYSIEIVATNSITFTTDPNLVFSVFPLSEYKGEIVFNGHTSSDPDVYDNIQEISTVTFDTNLYIYYTTGRDSTGEFQPGVRGGYCEFDRSFMFAVSQFNFNLCICLNNVWLCNNRFSGTFTPGIVPGENEPAGHYLYEIPFQMLGWGPQ